MACKARKCLDDDRILAQPRLEDLLVDQTTTNDVNLNLTRLNKYFEVHAFDETLAHRRQEFKTRQEHLQKRQEALHEKESMLKERIISYEMYVKELAMKRERSSRRIDDEKTLIENKRMEIDLLQQDLAERQEEKTQLESILVQYQPHWNLLVQMIDQSDQFQSIDEMIEKFDMLFASYQDILTTVQHSNQQLDDLQRELLLEMEKRKSQVSSMNNRFSDLQEQSLAVQQRIDRIQMDIDNDRQLSVERRTEIGAIKIAIESMFDLMRKYSHHTRRKNLHPEEGLATNPLMKLKHIDTFLDDLTFYVQHVNRRAVSRETIPRIESTKLNPRKPLPSTTTVTEETDAKNQWRGACEEDQQRILIKSVPQNEQSAASFSYEVRGEDHRFYTVEITRMKKSVEQINTSRPRTSLSPIHSFTSVLSRSKDSRNKGKRSAVSKPSAPTTRSTRTTFNLLHEQQIDPDRVPFSEVPFTRHPLPPLNDK